MSGSTLFICFLEELYHAWFIHIWSSPCGILHESYRSVLQVFSPIPFYNYQSFRDDSNVLKHNQTKDQIAQANTHTQRRRRRTPVPAKDIHKDIWIMLGVRWSPSPHVLLFISLFLLGSNNGYLNSYFSQSIWVYSNLIQLKKSNLYNLMIMSNLMLYLQQNGTHSHLANGVAFFSHKSCQNGCHLIHHSTNAWNI